MEGSTVGLDRNTTLGEENTAGLFSVLGPSNPTSGVRHMCTDQVREPEKDIPVSPPSHTWENGPLGVSLT